MKGIETCKLPQFGFGADQFLMMLASTGVRPASPSEVEDLIMKHASSYDELFLISVNSQGMFVTFENFPDDNPANHDMSRAQYFGLATGCPTTTPPPDAYELVLVKA